MARTIYLVRFWNGFRYYRQRARDDADTVAPTGQEPGSHSGQAFSTKDAAERFAASHTPVTLNPFWVACPLDTKRLQFLLTSEEDSKPYTTTIRLEDLIEKVQSLGLTPPIHGTSENQRPGCLTALLFWKRRTPRSVILWNTVTAWRDWWTENERRMADEQKIILWRFLIPEPYQIIPLELDE